MSPASKMSGGKGAWDEPRMRNLDGIKELKPSILSGPVERPVVDCSRWSNFPGRTTAKVRSGREG